MFLFAVQSFSTFGNVLIYEPKQAVIQSLCKFEVTWSESSYYEISWWQSSVREHKKKSNKKLWTLFITFAWINSLQEKRNGSSISVSMDLMPIKRRDLQSNYLLSMLNHFTLKYLMADLGGQEITVQRTLWRHQSNLFTGRDKRFTKRYSLARISVAVKPSSTSDRGVKGRGYYVEGRFSISFFYVFFVSLFFFFLRFLSEWGSADTKMHCLGPPRGCMFPCSLEKFTAVPLFLMNKLRCSPKFTFTEFPCSQKFCFVFPWFPNVFLYFPHNFFHISFCHGYFHRFYLVSHSTDTPRQNTSFASLMTLTGCCVCSDSSFDVFPIKF